MAGGGLEQLGAFMASIRNMESGGDYRAIGPMTKYGHATGAYQFIRDTWGGYGGYSQAYLAPPSVQDARAAQLMTEYFNRYNGSWWLVAVAWHGGRGAADTAAKNPGYASSIHDVNMSTKQYADSVIGGMGGKGGTPPPSGPSMSAFNNISGDLGYQSQGAPADVAKSMYGYLGWFVDHPEVGPIILQGAAEGWDLARLQGALAKSSWWRRTSENARKWDALRSMDPATMERRIDETSLSIGLQAQKLGLRIPNSRLAQIATKALRFGWNQGEIQLAIAAEMKYDPASAARGGIGQMVNKIKTLGADWLVPMTTKQAWQWSRRLVAGASTMDAVEAQMTAVAKSRFPHLAKLIEQGITPGQYFAPHRQAIASLLEVPVEGINFLSSRWNPVMAIRSDGKSPLRAMTVTEAERFARMQPSWAKTENAKKSVAETGQSIMEVFGAVK